MGQGRRIARSPCRLEERIERGVRTQQYFAHDLAQSTRKAGNVSHRISLASVQSVTSWDQ